MTLTDKELTAIIADYISDNGTEAFANLIDKASFKVITMNTEEEYGARAEIIENLANDLNNFLKP